jgi:hypothetical protein
MKLESLPDEVVASLQVRDGWRKQVAQAAEGLEFLVSDLVRWPTGSALRVAFLDGDQTLHSDIAEATRQITDKCNLYLDFGVDPASGEHRRWTTNDTAYAAQIRVGFNMGGYWSLVGTDSTDRIVGGPGAAIGGGPGQRSLNLGGFAKQRPNDWEGITRHEFLHALGFHHAHQNMRGPCEQEFRWEDDSGYQPTTDASGGFVPDGNGRRPGIYTYLAGSPNGWPRQKVDRNLRTVVIDDVVVGPFDRQSVMLYVFEPFFYKTDPSPCAPTGNGIDLSPGDERGLRLLYPDVAEEKAALEARASTALSVLAGGGQEAAGVTDSAYKDRVVELLTELTRG